MTTKNTLSIPAQPQRVSALALMANRCNVDPSKLLQTLKATVFKGASDDELLALVVVANEYKLNPLTKEIYAFPAKGGGIVPVVSIDGWVSMVNDHPQMDGMEFEESYDDTGKLTAITCRLWRKDRNRPIAVTEHLSECKRNSEPWKMEHRMLRHKALMQCARYAFGFSGVTDEDEASDTPGLKPATGRVVPQEAPQEAPQTLANPYAETEDTADEIDLSPPAQNTEPPMESPVEVSEDAERAELLSDIKATLADEDSTIAKFAPNCRKANLLAEGVQLPVAPIRDLRVIHANRLAILKGTFAP